MKTLKENTMNETISTYGQCNGKKITTIVASYNIPKKSKAITKNFSDVLENNKISKYSRSVKRNITRNIHEEEQRDLEI